MTKTNRSGFSLAELLIALAILGELATFTIPKIINTQQDSRKRSTSKEVAAMIASAYDQYKQSTAPSASMTPSQLKSYMNYVALDTSTTIDRSNNDGNITCNNSFWPCIKLHNGGILLFDDGAPLGGTATTNAMFFIFDADGYDSGAWSGSGKSVTFALYANGRITTIQDMTANTYWGGSPMGPFPNSNPPWFYW